MKKRSRVNIGGLIQDVAEDVDFVVIEESPIKKVEIVPKKEEESEPKVESKASEFIANLFK